MMETPPSLRRSDRDDARWRPRACAAAHDRRRRRGSTRRNRGLWEIQPSGMSRVSRFARCWLMSATSVYQRDLANQAQHRFARRLGCGMLGRLRKKTLEVVERRLEAFQPLEQPAALHQLVERARLQ